MIALMMAGKEGEEREMLGFYMEGKQGKRNQGAAAKL
jgi:hypothetical protein